MEMIPISKYKLPLEVVYYTTKSGKEKKFRLNLNNYNAAHRRVRGLAKKAYADLIQPLVAADAGLALNNVHITYTLYVKNKRLSDLDNWISIVQKFFLDVLVKNNIIIDDNFKYYKSFSCKFGGVTKNKSEYIEAVLYKAN